MAECYRHPGRETNVSCSMCARPICPDCMITTPVGMRCPECARDRTPVRRVSVGGSATSLSRGGSLIHDGGLNAVAIDVQGEWWRVVTAGFLHAGAIHLLFNMFALYVLGSLLEPAVGTARFVAIYLVSLLAGSCGALIVDPNQLTVGASGGIFGLMSAAFIMARHRGVEEIASQIGFFVVINLVFTFSVSTISVGGHVGGLIGGAIAALVVVSFERMRMPRPFVAEMAAMVVLCAIFFAGALAAAGVPDAVSQLGG